MRSIFTKSADGEYNADRLGRIKVLLVGNTGCGKTCLAHVLATGAPVSHTTYPTVGCNVTLMVLTYPADRAKSHPSLAGQEFFLELWDVGAHPRYETMRELFYQSVNGILLVHDLSFSRSPASLQRWCSEVCRLGSFVAPYSEDRAGLNLGGLPVPCMVVGNKLDLVPQYRGRYTLSWGQKLSSTLGGHMWRLKHWVGGVMPAPWLGPTSRADSSPGLCDEASTATHAPGGGLPRSTLLHGNLQACAARGDVDMHAVTSFFCSLIERRYCPSSSASLSSLDLGATDLSSPSISTIPTPEIHRHRLSIDRLPPVMYNAISEESSPYSSLSGSKAHTPFSSNPHLYRGSSGNLSSWAQLAQQALTSLQHAPPAQPHRLSGVNVAFKLQGGEADRSSGDMGEGWGGNAGKILGCVPNIKVDSSTTGAAGV